MDEKTELTVKYQNELNLIPLKNFNAKQMDLFFALCARMKDKGLQNIRFSFDDLKDLSDYKMTATKAFVSDLEKLYKDMLEYFELDSRIGSKTNSICFSQREYEYFNTHGEGHVTNDECDR